MVPRLGFKEWFGIRIIILKAASIDDLGKLYGDTNPSSIFASACQCKREIEVIITRISFR